MCAITSIFSLYVNSLVDRLRGAEVGVKCKDQRIPALLYANDMAISTCR